MNHRITSAIRIMAVSVAVAAVTAFLHFGTSLAFERAWIDRAEMERIVVPILGLWVLAGAGILTALGFLVFGSSEDDET